jgi:subtilisin family serine protease
MRRTLCFTLTLALLASACTDGDEPRLDKPYVVQTDGTYSPPHTSYVFKHVLPNGYLVRLTANELEEVEAQRGVLRVIADDVITAFEEQWNLDAIDQHGRPLDGRPFAPVGDGAGVRIYLVDTGVSEHPEFAGRLRQGIDVVDGTFRDCYGHGTHVAGIAAGSTYGVARAAEIVSARVLNCQGNGTLTALLQVLDWVGGQPCGVVNMSLGGFQDSTINAATEALVRKCHIVVVAAGNNGDDACGYSPASAPLAITVASSNIRDERSVWSNFGRCVDLFAPGEDVRSSWNDGSTRVISGTSMSTPHVAGAAAIYKQLGEANDAVITNSSEGLISGGFGAPNRFLFLTPALAAPTAFRVTIFWPGHNHAEWQDNSDGETGFELYRKVGLQWLKVADFPANTAHGHWDMVVSPTDQFRMRAIPNGAWSTVVNAAQAATGAQHRPHIITTLSR